MTMTSAELQHETRASDVELSMSRGAEDLASAGKVSVDEHGVSAGCEPRDDNVEPCPLPAEEGSCCREARRRVMWVLVIFIVLPLLLALALVPGLFYGIWYGVHSLYCYCTRIPLPRDTHWDEESLPRRNDTSTRFGRSSYSNRCLAML